MFFILYQVTNNLNGKIYVGVHKTNDLHDGYMGSGKVIKAAIAKHGIENFTKVILEQFETSAAMYAREKEVVTDEFLLREDTYNLRRGGTGGFDYINSAGLRGSGHVWTSDDRIAASAIRSRISSEEWSEINLARFEKVDIDTRRLWSNSGRAASRSEDAIAKRRATYSLIGHSRGEKNSQYGKCWITNGTENRKIPVTDDMPVGWWRGRKF